MMSIIHNTVNRSDNALEGDWVHDDGYLQRLIFLR